MLIPQERDLVAWQPTNTQGLFKVESSITSPTKSPTEKFDRSSDLEFFPRHHPLVPLPTLPCYVQTEEQLPFFDWQSYGHRYFVLVLASVSGQLPDYPSMNHCNC